MTLRLSENDAKRMKIDRLGQRGGPQPEGRRRPKKPTPQLTVTKAPRGAREFTIPTAPVPKPRQTRRDRYDPSVRVQRYRAWADIARQAAPVDIGDKEAIAGGIVLGATFYLPIPESWTPKRREQVKGKRYLGQPDIGNLMKSLEDALWPDDDSMVWKYREPERLYDDGNGPRTVVRLWPGVDPFGLIQLAAGFELADRLGAETDEPEGTRYIQISDTQAREIAELLKRAAR